METIWKDIEGFEGLYKVSNMGEVLSCKKNIILKTKTGNSKYYYVSLFKGGVVKYQYIHRLVAQSFIPNPENKKEVNHKDGNRLDNRVFMLEWVTMTENQIHSWKHLGRVGTATGKFGAANCRSKSINQLSDSGKVVEVFGGLSEVSRKTGIEFKNISACALGKRKHAGGYSWAYVNL